MTATTPAVAQAHRTSAEPTAQVIERSITKRPDARKPQRSSRRTIRSRSAPSGSGEKRLKSGAITVGYSTSTRSWNAIHASHA